MTGSALVTGATGFIGGRVSSALVEAGWTVRCLVRDRGRARALEQCGFELHEGDVLRPETLRGAGRGVDVAYYLVHSMGRGADGDFAARERAAAEAFSRMARDEGVGRVVYLGGLGDESKSEHLRSRHTTALVLREHGPPLTYFRAAMVVVNAHKSGFAFATPSAAGQGRFSKTPANCSNFRPSPKSKSS